MKTRPHNSVQPSETRKRKRQPRRRWASGCVIRKRKSKLASINIVEGKKGDTTKPGCVTSDRSDSGKRESVYEGGRMMSVFLDNTMLVDEQENIMSNASSSTENKCFSNVPLDHINRKLQTDTETRFYSNTIPSTRSSPAEIFEDNTFSEIIEEVLDLQQEFGIHEDETNFFQALQLHIYNCLLTDGSSGVSMPLYQQRNFMDHNNAEQILSELLSSVHINNTTDMTTTSHSTTDPIMQPAPPLPPPEYTMPSVLLGPPPEHTAELEPWQPPLDDIDSYNMLQSATWERPPDCNNSCSTENNQYN